MTQTLMIQGTTSAAGKSTLVAGLCRLYKRKNIRVAPFKPQNMSLNSAVTIDGGEIGRAQALQALAAGIDPLIDMNPVLLKPNTAIGAQVIIQGKAIGNMNAHEYHQYKPQIFPQVIASFNRLKSQFDRIIVEGAGSPAEINLRNGDIANMGFAKAINCPVLVVADIDRGGVFAHLLGTLEILSPDEQRLIKGFIINRFRGDQNLLTPAIDWLENRTGIPVLGVVPFLEGLYLDEEDSLKSKRIIQNSSSIEKKLQIIVFDYPRTSNITDIDPLINHPQIELNFLSELKATDNLPGADLIILPGSKNAILDLHWLKERDLDKYILRHLRLGGKVIAICGGLQMLGKSINDPNNIESEIERAPGLNLIDIETTLLKEKKLLNVEGYLNLPGHPAVKGYEIHMGKSSGSALATPAILNEANNDGFISENGQILGTYWHGIFDSSSAINALLEWAGLELSYNTPDYQVARMQQIERLADCLEEHLDIAKIESFFMNNPSLPKQALPI